MFLGSRDRWTTHWLDHGSDECLLAGDEGALDVGEGVSAGSRRSVAGVAAGGGWKFGLGMGAPFGGFGETLGGIGVDTMFDYVYGSKR